MARKLLGDGVLRHIRILELVNHEVDIAFLILLRHIGHALEELVCLQQQVVEIDRRALAQQVLVALVGTDDDLVPVASGAVRQTFRTQKFALRARYAGQDGARREPLGIEFKLY